MNQNYSNIICQALQSVNYKGNSDNRKFKAALLDLSEEYPDESEFIVSVADDAFLKLCQKATVCNTNQQEIIKENASRYLQNSKYHTGKQYADQISEILVNAFMQYSRNQTDSDIYIISKEQNCIESQCNSQRNDCHVICAADNKKHTTEHSVQQTSVLLNPELEVDKNDNIIENTASLHSITIENGKSEEHNIDNYIEPKDDKSNRVKTKDKKFKRAVIVLFALVAIIPICVVYCIMFVGVHCDDCLGIAFDLPSGWRCKDDIDNYYDDNYRYMYITDKGFTIGIDSIGGEFGLPEYVMDASDIPENVKTESLLIDSRLCKILKWSAYPDYDTGYSCIYRYRRIIIPVDNDEDYNYLMMEFSYPSSNKEEFKADFESIMDSITIL